MTTKKQTKTKKEKQATVVQNHQNPEVLRDMYIKQGMSAGAIGRHFGVSRAMILYRLKKCGINVSKTRKTKSADAKSDYLNKTQRIKAETIRQRKELYRDFMINDLIEGISKE